MLCCVVGAEGVCVCESRAEKEGQSRAEAEQRQSRDREEQSRAEQRQSRDRAETEQISRGNDRQLVPIGVLVI